MLNASGGDPLALATLRLHLAGLMRFVSKIDAASMPLLTPAAEAQAQQSMSDFLAGLARIAETNLSDAADLLDIAERLAHPFWDHNDNLQKLLSSLYDNPATKVKALKLTDAFLDVNGIKEWASATCI